MDSFSIYLYSIFYHYIYPCCFSRNNYILKKKIELNTINMNNNPYFNNQNEYHESVFDKIIFIVAFLVIGAISYLWFLYYRIDS